MLLCPARVSSAHDPPPATNAEERVAILEQKLAALESAHADRRACGNNCSNREEACRVVEASVAALLHEGGTSAAVPGRCGQATDVDAIASAATALSLDDTVGNHTVR